MPNINEIITWIRNFSNSDIGILSGFISLASWAFGLGIIIIKKIRIAINSQTGRFVFIVLLSPAIIPVMNLVFSTWSGAFPVSVNCLSMLGILISLFLVYDLKKQQSPTQQNNLPFNVEQFELEPGKSHKFFGELSIYLVGEYFRNLQTGHVVTAKIWSASYKERVIKHKTVGYSIIYACGAIYRVRITKAVAGKVLFEVAKLIPEKA